MPRKHRKFESRPDEECSNCGSHNLIVEILDNGEGERECLTCRGNPKWNT